MERSTPEARGHGPRAWGSGPVTVTDESLSLARSLSLWMRRQASRDERGGRGQCGGRTKRGQSGVWPAPLNWSSLGGPDSPLFCSPLSPAHGRCAQTSQLFLIRGNSALLSRMKPSLFRQPSQARKPETDTKQCHSIHREPSPAFLFLPLGRTRMVTFSTSVPPAPTPVPIPDVQQSMGLSEQDQGWPNSLQHLLEG